jgi:hypothetical protein
VSRCTGIFAAAGKIGDGLDAVTPLPALAAEPIQEASGGVHIPAEADFH